MNWVYAQLKNFIECESKNKFKKIFKKIQLRKIKITLKNRIQKEILDKYGENEYFNKLDSFLESNRVFENLFTNNKMSMLNENYKSCHQFINYYARFFIEKYPNYIHYIDDINCVISQYFIITFDTINKFQDNETARLINNNVRELIVDLKVNSDNQYNEILDGINGLAAKINNESINILSDNTEIITSENLAQYYSILLRGLANKGEIVFDRKLCYNGKKEIKRYITNRKKSVILRRSGMW